MAKVVLKSYEAFPCEAEVFTINGQTAWINEFGNYEYDPEETCEFEEYYRWGCVGKYFKTLPYNENSKTVKKYHLTKEEYDDICSDLECKFAIGTCGWCI